MLGTTPAADVDADGLNNVFVAFGPLIKSMLWQTRDHSGASATGVVLIDSGRVRFLRYEGKGD